MPPRLLPRRVLAVQLRQNRLSSKQLRIPVERIEKAILLVHGKKVILDRDLAEFYGVRTKALKQAFRRNAKRFPQDFIFELTKEEFENWRSQFVTFNRDKMGLRYNIFEAIRQLMTPPVPQIPVSPLPWRESRS